MSLIFFKTSQSESCRSSLDLSGVCVCFHGYHDWIKGVSGCPLWFNLSMCGHSYILCSISPDAMTEATHLHTPSLCYCTTCMSLDSLWWQPDKPVKASTCSPVAVPKGPNFRIYVLWGEPVTNELQLRVLFQKAGSLRLKSWRGSWFIVVLHKRS